MSKIVITSKKIPTGLNVYSQIVSSLIPTLKGLNVKTKLNMPGTFSQIYIHVVFAVRGRLSLIHESWEESLYKYITGIVQKKEQKMLAINGMPDHVHLFIGVRPNACLSELVREIKKSSNEFIKVNKFCSGFNWQEGYGAFSYSHSQLSNVISYIMKQKEHHKKKSFKDEYYELLQKFDIRFEEKYLFDWLDDYGQKKED